MDFNYRFEQEQNKEYFNEIGIEHNFPEPFSIRNIFQTAIDVDILFFSIKKIKNKVVYLHNERSIGIF